jgi:RNA polymerase sigma-70 factor (ECF subfamily)
MPAAAGHRPAFPRRVRNRPANSAAVPSSLAVTDAAAEPCRRVLSYLVNVTASRQRPIIPFSSKQTDVSSAEADLVSRCRAGEVEAFEILYRQQAARIYTLACRIAGSPEDGEDLLQEIFLLAYRKLGSFKGDAAIGTWLYRLAMNHCLDYVRSRRAKMNKLTDPLDANQSRQPAARRESLDIRLDLERAVEQLPDGCREAFVLHDIVGLDHREVGDLLGVAEGTSKSQVFKARAKLRGFLRGR